MAKFSYNFDATNDEGVSSQPKTAGTLLVKWRVNPFRDNLVPPPLKNVHLDVVIFYPIFLAPKPFRGHLGETKLAPKPCLGHLGDDKPSSETVTRTFRCDEPSSETLPRTFR